MSDRVEEILQGTKIGKFNVKQLKAEDEGNHLVEVESWDCGYDKEAKRLGALAIVKPLSAENSIRLLAVSVQPTDSETAYCSGVELGEMIAGKPVVEWAMTQLFQPNVKEVEGTVAGIVFTHDGSEFFSFTKNFPIVS